MGPRAWRAERARICELACGFEPQTRIRAELFGALQLRPRVHAECRLVLPLGAAPVHGGATAKGLNEPLDLLLLRHRRCRRRCRLLRLVLRRRRFPRRLLRRGGGAKQYPPREASVDHLGGRSLCRS